jgi:Protein of unknown function (DUF559)
MTIRFERALDGKRHEWFSDYDAGRTEILERLGVRVIRFTNAEVCDDLDSVLIGFSLMTEQGALILHAIVAPIAFAGLSWVYRMFLYMAS